MTADFSGPWLHHRHWLHLCVLDVIHLGSAVNVPRRGLGHILADLPLVLILKQHVVDGRQTDTRAENVVNARSLAEQRIDEWSSARNERSFAQET